MGMSPSADLYWGFDLGDMTHPTTWESLKPPWMDEYTDDATGEYHEPQDWEEVYAERAHGWVEVPFPDELCPDRSAIYHKHRGSHDSFQKAEAEIQVAEAAFRNTPEYQVWSANRQELRELATDSNVRIGTYGYSDDPCYFVYVLMSHQRVDDYGDIELQPLAVGDDWKTQLLDFMKLMELPLLEGEEPTWHMNCSYS